MLTWLGYVAAASSGALLLQLLRMVWLAHSRPPRWRSDRWQTLILLTLAAVWTVSVCAFAASWVWTRS